MLKSQRFDILRPLFTQNENDNRFRLFLSIMKNRAGSTGNVTPILAASELKLFEQVDAMFSLEFKNFVQDWALHVRDNAIDHASIKKQITNQPMASADKKFFHAFFDLICPVDSGAAKRPIDKNSIHELFGSKELEIDMEKDSRRKRVIELGEDIYGVAAGAKAAAEGAALGAMEAEGEARVARNEATAAKVEARRAGDGAFLAVAEARRAGVRRGSPSRSLGVRRGSPASRRGSLASRLGGSIQTGGFRVDQSSREIIDIINSIRARTPLSGATSFTIRMGNLVWQKLIERLNAKESTTGSSVSFLDGPLGLSVDKLNNIVDYKGANVGVDSPTGRKDFTDIPNAGNDNEYCRLIGFTKGAEAEQNCIDLVEKCLGGDNIKKCRDHMLDIKFWGSVYADIKATTIPRIRVLLEKFQFKQVNNGEGNAPYESFDEWLQGDALSTFEDDEKKRIGENKPLRAVLVGLVDRYNMETGLTRTDQIHFNKSSQYGSTQDKFKHIRALNPQPAVMVEKFVAHQRTSDHIRHHAITQVVGGQIGSGWSINDGLVGYIPSNQLQYTDAASITARQIQALINNGRALKKELDPKDLARINKELKDFFTAQKRLENYSEILDQFNILMEIDSSAHSGTTINFEQAKKLINRQKHLLKRRNRKLTTAQTIVSHLMKIFN